MMLSKNGVAVVLFLLSTLGMTVSEAQAMDFVAGLVQVVSFILMVWNQWQRPDVDKFVFKK